MPPTPHSAQGGKGLADPGEVGGGGMRQYLGGCKGRAPKGPGGGGVVGGVWGARRIGYCVSGLKAELQKILGLDREWPVALVGFGNLGSALFHYKGFARQGFRIAVVFDDDPAKAGRSADGAPI